MFKRPGVQYFHMPPPPGDIEQLDCCKLLGVIFQSNFKMDSHIQFVLSQCAQRLYLLKLLLHQGLADAQLSAIANAVIISGLLCVLPCQYLSIESMLFTTYAAFWLSPALYHCSRTYE